MQEVADEAAEQALRAVEIVRSLHQLVNAGETERRIEELPPMIEEVSALVEVHRARMMERLRVRQLAEVIRLGVIARLSASRPANKRKG